MSSLDDEQSAVGSDSSCVWRSVLLLSLMTTEANSKFSGSEILWEFMQFVIIAIHNLLGAFTNSVFCRYWEALLMIAVRRSIKDFF